MPRPAVIASALTIVALVAAVDAPTQPTLSTKVRTGKPVNR